mmetsp:Transcript_6044/g.13354  ORF Transcript_6044/g.13354 Transcript_6044/m.13354 type:complete len:361 (-) Transcript_6044:899-1981(-)
MGSLIESPCNPRQPSVSCEEAVPGVARRWLSAFRGVSSEAVAGMGVVAETSQGREALDSSRSAGCSAASRCSARQRPMSTTSFSIREEWTSWTSSAVMTSSSCCSCGEDSSDCSGSRTGVVPCSDGDAASESSRTSSCSSCSASTCGSGAGGVSTIEDSARLPSTWETLSLSISSKEGLTTCGFSFSAEVTSAVEKAVEGVTAAAPGGGVAVGACEGVTAVSTAAACDGVAVAGCDSSTTFSLGFCAEDGNVSMCTVSMRGASSRKSEVVETRTSPPRDGSLAWNLSSAVGGLEANASWKLGCVSTWSWPSQKSAATSECSSEAGGELTLSSSWPSSFCVGMASNSNSESSLRSCLDSST